jgi:hypothetical protein
MTDLSNYIQGSALLIADRRSITLDHAVRLVKWYIKFLRRQGLSLDSIIDRIDALAVGVDHRAIRYGHITAVQGDIASTAYLQSETLALLRADCQLIIAGLKPAIIEKLSKPNGWLTNSVYNALHYAQIKNKYRLNYLGDTETRYLRDTLSAYLKGELII